MLADQIAEAHSLWGTQAYLFSPKSYSMYLDNSRLSEGIEVRIILQNQPKKTLLMNLGWWHEANGNNPIIAFLPYAVNGSQLKVIEKSVIVMDDRTSLEVQEVNRNYLLGLWQILKLTPYEKDNRREVVKTKTQIKTQILRSSREEAE